VAVLFENLADGMTLNEILDAYPTLSREAALAALREAEASLEREQAGALCAFFCARQRATLTWASQDDHCSVPRRQSFFTSWHRLKPGAGHSVRSQLKHIRLSKCFE